MILSLFHLRICNRCNITNNIISKGWCRDYDVGYGYICSKCYHRIYRKKHPQSYRNWCKRNPHYHLNWKREHQESVNKSSRQWKLRNPQHIEEYNRNRPPSRKTPEKIKQDSIHRITYKDKRIYLQSNPRTGQCAICHKIVGIDDIRRTLRHHEKYHDDNPLKDTIELCNACHARKHPSRALRMRLIHSNRKAAKFRYMSGTFHIPEQPWMERLTRFDNRNLS